MEVRKYHEDGKVTIIINDCDPETEEKIDSVLFPKEEYTIPSGPHAGKTLDTLYSECGMDGTVSMLGCMLGLNPDNQEYKILDDIYQVYDASVRLTAFVSEKLETASKQDLEAFSSFHKTDSSRTVQEEIEMIRNEICIKLALLAQDYDAIESYETIASGQYGGMRIKDVFLMNGHKGLAALLMSKKEIGEESFTRVVEFVLALFRHPSYLVEQEVVDAYKALAKDLYQQYASSTTEDERNNVYKNIIENLRSRMMHSLLNRAA